MLQKLLQSPPGNLVFFSDLFIDYFCDAGQLETSKKYLDLFEPLAKGKGERYPFMMSKLYLGYSDLSAQKKTSTPGYYSFKEIEECGLELCKKSGEYILGNVKASTCLAKVYQLQGKTAEAKQLLAPWIEKFTGDQDIPVIRNLYDVYNQLK